MKVTLALLLLIGFAVALRVGVSLEVGQVMKATLALLLLGFAAALTVSAPRDRLRNLLVILAVGAVVIVLALRRYLTWLS